MSLARRLSGATLAACVLFAMPAAARTATDPAPGFVGEFLGQFVVTFVVGAVVLAFGPDYAARLVGRIRSMPGESFLTGFLVVALSIGAGLLLAITIIGLLIVVPAAIVLGVLVLLGHVLVAVTLGTVLLDGDGRWGSLLVGAALLSAFSAIPFLGGLVELVVVFIGLGAIVDDGR